MANHRTRTVYGDRCIKVREKINSKESLPKEINSSLLSSIGMVKIKVTVISQEGHCNAGNKVGDEIIFDWETHEITGRLCLHALYSALPKIYALAQGGNVAFATSDDGSKVARHACPDGYNPLILEMKIMD